MTSPSFSPSLTDLQVIDFSPEVRLIAHELKEKIRTFPGSDHRKTVLYCICSSGLMLDIAQDNQKALAAICASPTSGSRKPNGEWGWVNGSPETIERIERRVGKYLSSEAETQQILLEAGITDNETAMLWLSSASETIDRDVAELEALESRHLDEINAFFRSKGAPIDDET
jgi:hypothetical protein